jgi:hypothetical protein
MTGLVLSREPLADPFARWEALFALRQSEATVFYDELLPQASAEDHRILRQALAGLVWSQQFYWYDVARWLDGDGHPPPESRKAGRNRQWRHFRLKAVISMPDKWEYPWFAAWDLALQAAGLALLDPQLAKQQVELLLDADALHPSGQIPAYEWDLGDANPPLHAAAALKVYRAERVQSGREDRGFLKRVLHKLLLQLGWWINRKDREGHNLFEGGFLGLDNISPFDRSEPLPPGFSLKQADATGWMALFALDLTLIALELTVEDPDYEDIAIQCYLQFLQIAAGIAGRGDARLSLWDEADGFYQDLLMGPNGERRRIGVISWVGLVPLFACEVLDQRLLRAAPRFAARLSEHGGGGFDGHVVCACPEHENERGEHLLSLVDPDRSAASCAGCWTSPSSSPPTGCAASPRSTPAGRTWVRSPARAAAHRLSAGGGRHRTLRRQLQLAGARVAAHQLPAHPGPGALSSLSGGELHRSGPLPGRATDHPARGRHPDRRAPGGPLPPRPERTYPRLRTGLPPAARPPLAGPAPLS